MIFLGESVGLNVCWRRFEQGGVKVPCPNVNKEGPRNYFSLFEGIVPCPAAVATH